MKILIVSDTHRKDDNLERVIREQAPLDMLISFPPWTGRLS